MTISPINSPSVASADPHGAPVYSDFFEVLVLPCAAAVPRSHLDFSAHWRFAGLPLKDANRILVARASQAEYALSQFFDRWSPSRPACEARAETALHFAAMIGHDIAACALIDAGAALDARDTEGETPLFRAAEGEDYEVALQLLLAGADVNASNLEGATPLHYAAERGRLGCAIVLLDHGADPRHENHAGLRPLDVASRSMAEVLEVLINDILANRSMSDGAERDFAFPTHHAALAENHDSAVATVRQWAQARAAGPAPREGENDCIAALLTAIRENRQDDMMRILQQAQGGGFRLHDIQQLLNLAVELDRPMISDLLSSVSFKRVRGAGLSRMFAPVLSPAETPPGGPLSERLSSAGRRAHGLKNEADDAHR